MVTEQDIKDYCKDRGYDYDFILLFDEEDMAELRDEVEAYKNGEDILDGIVASTNTLIKYISKQIPDTE